MNIDNLRQLLDEATPEGTRLVLVSGNLLDVWGARTIEGYRITADWGEQQPEGWYVPTFTVDAEDRADLLAAVEALERLLSDPRISLPFAVPEVFRTGEYPPDSAVMVVEDARAVLRRLRGEEGDR